MPTETTTLEELARKWATDLADYNRAHYDKQQAEHKITRLQTRLQEQQKELMRRAGDQTKVIQVTETEVVLLTSSDTPRVMPLTKVPR